MILRQQIVPFYNWSYLAFSDIQARYRRSSLGVFWITLTTLLSSTAIAFVYSSIFNIQFQTYLPYVMLGVCLWNFTATCINELTASLIQNRHLLLGRKIEPQWLWYRITVRNLIILAHSMLVVLPIVWLSSGLLAPFALFESIAGMFLVSLILFTYGGLISVASTRYGDIPQAINALIGLAFLVTPVLWDVKVLGDKKSYLVEFNLFHHMVAVMRGPLLGQETHSSTWLILVIVALFGLVGLRHVLIRFRRSCMPWL
jgi:ABC-type polysaccharide/polyol phosphate export permease